MENTVFRSKLPTHGKSRKLSAIGNGSNNSYENGKTITVQHAKDMKKCACGWNISTIKISIRKEKKTIIYFEKMKYTHK